MKIREIAPPSTGTQIAPPSTEPQYELATDRLMTYNGHTGISRIYFLSEDRQGRPTANLQDESKQDKNTLVVDLPYVTLCHLIVGFDKKAGNFTFSHVSIFGTDPYAQIKNENPMDFIVIDVSNEFNEKYFRKAMMKNNCAIASLTHINPTALGHTYQEPVRITYSVATAEIVISSHKNGPSLLIETPFKLDTDLTKTAGSSITDASTTGVEKKASP